MHKYQVMFHRPSGFHKTSRTVKATSKEDAMQKVFDMNIGVTKEDIIEVWERVLYTQVKRSLES